MVSYLYSYLIIINLCSFISFGADKLKAKNRKWRTPEATLLTLAAIGGSVGAFFGMRIWRHKTHHRKFTILVPLFMIFHISLMMWNFL